MFNIGEIVVHPGMGVCKIENITDIALGKEPKKKFYVLCPVYENDKTKVYVPTNGKISLRYPLSEESIGEVLELVKTTEDLWVENDIQRKTDFQNILRSGNHIKIIKIIKELHEKNEEKKLSGKKLHIADEKILKEAEKHIHGELAYSMQINPDEVAPYIISKLKNEAE